MNLKKNKIGIKKYSIHTRTLALILILYFSPFNSIYSQNSSAKLILDFKSSIKAGERIQDDILLTDSVFYYIAYEKKNKTFSYKIYKNTIKGKNISINAYYQDTIWTLNQMQYLAESDELILYQTIIPGYPHSNSNRVLIFNNKLNMVKEIKLDFADKRFVYFTAYAKYINFFLKDGKSVYLYSFDREGRRISIKDLQIDTNPIDVDAIGKSKDGNIVLTSYTLNRLSMKQEMSDNSTIKDYLHNEIVDSKNNNSTTLYIYLYNNQGKLLDKKILKRKNHDMIISVYHFGKEQYYVGIINNFLQDEKEHYEFLSINKDSVVYSDKLYYKIERERYCGSLTPNLIQTSDGRYYLTFNNTDGSLKLCLYSADTYELLDCYDIGGWPYLAIECNSNDEFILESDRTLYYFSIKD